MSENTALVELRQKLAGNIARGEYKTLIDYWLELISRPFGIKSTNSLAIQLQALIFSLSSLLISTLILLIFDLPTQKFIDIAILLPLVLIVFITVIGTCKHWQLVFSTIRSHLLDAILNLENLQDLENWLRLISNKRLALLWSVVFMTVFEAYFNIAAVMAGNVTPRLSVVVAYSIFIFYMGLLFYDFVVILNFPLRLCQYQLKLYWADPASSELVAGLSRMFSSFLFLVALMAGILSVFLAFFNPLGFGGIIFVLLWAWGPLFLSFFIHQTALKRIIVNGKQKALTDIQTQIETLRSQAEIPSTETLAHIRALTDYHDYIKSRRNSMLDVQAGLNFLNSLLFPVIGFLLGNIKEESALIK